MGYDRIKRVFDVVVSVFLLILLFIPGAGIALLVKITSNGPIFHITDRIGANNSIFKMYKFRTMRVDTPQVATHLLRSPGKYLTPFGFFLRKTSLDEVPQLLNVLSGEMSLVGPRPALFNQNDLVSLRTEKGIHTLIPGISGWAQINGRDDLSIPVKVGYDEYYMKNRSFLFDVAIIWKTLFKVAKRTGVRGWEV